MPSAGVLQQIGTRQHIGEHRMQQRRWARRLTALVAVALVAAAAGCSSATAANTETAITAAAIASGAAPANSAATTTTAGSPTSAGTGGATEGLRVPDAFTAVTVRPLSAPTFPFKGTDGKYHVAYDLELTNASALPATI